VLTRFALLSSAVGTSLALAACVPSSAPEDTYTVAPPSTTSTAPSGDNGSEDASSSAPPPASPIGVPANACTLLDPVTVARLAGAKAAVPTPSNQGPFHSCAYRVSTEAGASGTVYLDVSDQRAGQLYDVATAGVQLSELPAIGTRASLSPATGKVYVQTTRAFFTLGLPITLGSLSTPNGLRTAAEELASTIAARLGP